MKKRRQSFSQYLEEDLNQGEIAKIRSHTKYAQPHPAPNKNIWTQKSRLYSEEETRKT